MELEETDTVSFAAAAAIGVKVITAIVTGANTIEGLKGAVKGADKRALALNIAHWGLGNCGDTAHLASLSPKIREKQQRLNDAYVDLMNAYVEEGIIKP